ncbi:hypothetical protein CAL29_03585 [Bordetella genomosp. 10]|uniref:Peptidase M56 domain-containing protein n=1 Tax=Bordetella genomosp. 10 TaxID=1416804 RepID=A0A261SL60_9BORD|nr:M56 family metallopeptidase [Bordetella genomosp. 10]OZI37500.1 hypothetical protein CAL29_03585 [Bordetella genomosp. 10]
MSQSLLVLAWALGKTLPVFLWKGLCIHAVAAGLLLPMRPGDTRPRHAVLCLALLACGVVFAVDVAGAYRAELASLASGRISYVGGGQAAPAGAFWPLWLAAGWFAGAALVGARIGVGLAWLRRALDASAPWTDAAWRTRVDAMARALRLPRAVGLRIAHGLSSPVTAGWLKPVILVPAHIVTGMPADLLEALLAHELAHVRRLDFLVNLLQHGAEVLLFFHPSVWWLSRRIRVERERIADEVAAGLIGDPRRLARALDALSRAADPGAGDARVRIAQGAKDGPLVDRIRRLAHPRPAPRRGLALPLLAAMLALAGATLWSAADLGPARAARALAENGGHGGVLADYPAIQALIEASGAAHVLVVDSRSGDRLAARAENDVVPIASLTKLMTAMVVMDASLDMTQPVRVAEEDAAATKDGMSRLPVGTVATRDTLLKLTLMASDNRAAYALARSYPGGLPAFELATQRKMAALGLAHTTLREPAGVSSANQSTATDIERIVRAAANYPAIVRDTVALGEDVRGEDGVIRYRNTNVLVGRPDWDIRLSKTATSERAGRCLAMRVQVHGHDLTLVLLNARRQPA